MLKVTETDTELVVQHRSYVIGVIMLVMVAFLFVEHGADLLSGEIKKVELFGLFAGALISILGIYYFVEFGTFTFSKINNRFDWQWNNLFKKKSGQIPISKISKVRRDALESSDMGGYQNTYRLIVIADDGEKISLSRSFSGIHDKQLDDAVNQIRKYIS